MNNYIQELLGLKDVIVTNVETFKNEKHIHITMERKTHFCPNCNFPTERVHDYRTQKVKDLEICGFNGVLILKKRRYVCPNCNKKFYENIDFLPTYYRTTNRLWAYILHELSKTRSMSCIAKDVNLSTTSIMRVLDKVSLGMKHLPTTLAIDEFRGNAQGEKFQTLLTNPKRKIALDVLATRKQEDILEYFSRFPIHERLNVKYVVMDMSGSFKPTIKKALPNAQIIADKFHVVRQVTWAFEAVRKRIQKEFYHTRRKYFKNSRKLLLKNPNNLTPDQVLQVANMLDISLELRNAYHLKNMFYSFMKSKDICEAKKRLKYWYLMVTSVNIKEFNDCLETFNRWQKEILNAFRFHLTNGFTEGCNNRIKVIKRVSYGFQNFERFRKKILHSLYKSSA